MTAALPSDAGEVGGCADACGDVSRWRLAGCGESGGVRLGPPSAQRRAQQICIAAKAATKRTELPVAVRDTIRCTACLPARNVSIYITANARVNQRSEQ